MGVPAMSARKSSVVPAAQPSAETRAPAPVSRDRVAVSARSERTSGAFPAFDTDWDVPAFQRRNS
jgi:hypothetical protein